jgi:hypothetical protein
MLKWLVGAASAVVMLGGSAQAAVIYQVTGLIGVNNGVFGDWIPDANGNVTLGSVLPGIPPLAIGIVSDPTTQSIPQPPTQTYTISITSSGTILSTNDQIGYEARDYLYSSTGSGYAFYGIEDSADWDVIATPTVAGGDSTEQFVAQDSIENFPQDLTAPLTIQRYQGIVFYEVEETFSASSIGQPFTLTLSTSIPEPATWSMLLMGVFGIGAVLRGRRSLYTPIEP